MKHEWEKLFEWQLLLMKKSRKAVEMVYTEKSSGDANSIAKSKAIAEEFKRHRRSYDALVRAAEK